MRFVFVHGGFHAAWCWEHTIAALEGLGHEGVAVDLPGHGARVDEESTLANRRDAIVTALQPGDVLVGHSGGGFDATLAADAAPDLVSHITYVAAALPREGRTYPEAMAMRDSEEGEFDADVGEMLGYLKFDDDGAMWFADFDGAWKYFYHDCDEATARWAFERLGPERFGDTTVTPVSVPAFWAARSTPQLHPLPSGSVDAAVAGRHGNPPSRRRAIDDRHVAFAVPEPSAGTGRATRARHDDQAHRPVGTGLNLRRDRRFGGFHSHFPAHMFVSA
jgi:pimeloyl-ACP methyl ester carboxylesterase